MDRITGYKLDVIQHQVQITFTETNEKHRVIGYGPGIITLDNGMYEATSAVLKDVQAAFTEAQMRQLEEALPGLHFDREKMNESKAGF